MGVADRGPGDGAENGDEEGEDVDKNVEAAANLAFVA